MLGLRAPRRRAAEQHQAHLVARLRSPARRYGGAGRLDPHAPDRVEGQRSRRQLHGPDGGLPRVQAPLPRRPGGHDGLDALLPGDQGQQVHDQGWGAVQALRRPPHPLSRVRQGRAHGAAPVQPDVQDVHGTGGGGRRPYVPPARDGAGHLRQLRQRAAGHAAQAAVRHRADRQGLSQRDHARQLHLPLARIRADGDRVLRQPARPARGPAGRRGLARPLDRRLPVVVHALRPRSRQRKAARAPRRRAGPLFQADGGSPLPVPDGLERADGNREPHGLRPQAAREVQRQVAHVVRRGAQGARGAVRDRALRGRGPRAAGLPARRLPGGGGARRQARGAAVPSRAGADQDRGAAAAQEAPRDRRRRPRPVPPADASLADALR